MRLGIREIAFIVLLIVIPVGAWWFAFRPAMSREAAMMVRIEVQQEGLRELNRATAPIGDVEQDARRQRAGKPGWNWALVYGTEAAEREVLRRLNACRLTLSRNGLFTPLWKDIYKKVWGMTTA